MPTFLYKSATSAGGIVEGTIEAPSQKGAVEKIQSQGQVPIRVDECRARPRKQAHKLFKRSRVTQGQISVVTSELATLLNAGLPLERALEILVSLSGEEKLAEVLTDVRERVKSGVSFAEALDAQGGIFSRFYVNLVKAGESGGALESVLERLAEHLESAHETRESISSALIYPIILVFVAVVSIFILLSYVIPQFADLFEGVGETLPLATRITLGISDAIQAYGWLLVLLIIAVTLIVRSQLERAPGRYRIHGWILGLPVVGTLVTQVEVARFSRTLSILLSNGVPMLRAMAIVKDTMSNDVLAEGVENVATSLKEGEQLAQQLKAKAGFPDFSVHMIQVGEESGKLEDMLVRVADLYEREIQVGIKRSLALLEPVMILVLGVIIAGVVMSILVAILGINKLVF